MLVIGCGDIPQKVGKIRTQETLRMSDTNGDVYVVWYWSNGKSFRQAQLINRRKKYWWIIITKEKRWYTRLDNISPAIYNLRLNKNIDEIWGTDKMFHLKQQEPRQNGKSTTFLNNVLEERWVCLMNAHDSTLVFSSNVLPLLFPLSLELYYGKRLSLSLV